MTRKSSEDNDAAGQEPAMFTAPPGRFDEAACTLMVSGCTVLAGRHEPGTAYHAVDYINALGSNPLIGSVPDGHQSVFLDMTDPFMEPPHSPGGTTWKPAVLAGWPGDEALDHTAREWLQTLGADIVSPHGVEEAIAARRNRTLCVALFYEWGDREGIRTVSSYLTEAGLNPGQASVSVS